MSILVNKLKSISSKIKVCAFLVVIFLTQFANASHLVGGFLTYRWLGSNGSITQYRVNMYAYRDCSKDGTTDERPFDKVITLCAYNSDKSLYNSYDVNLLSKKKVNPVGNTNCPEVASACLEQGLYEVVISLPVSSKGFYLKWERCCRNTQNNLRDQGGSAYQGQTYFGYIPATNIQNSSPYFLDIPVPFICKNDTTTIRNRAIDPDGDSLSYRLITPWQGASANSPTVTCNSFMANSPNVDYNNGYSASQPFGNSGLAYVDAFNGLTTYMSKVSGRFAVAIEVTEWRNGVAISTVRLDLQILVINCSPNNKPSLGYQTKSKYWTVEAGQPFCYDITAKDLKDSTQIITLQAYSDIITGINGYTYSKAIMTPAVNAGKKTVVSKFCWTPDCNIPTKDTFRVTFEAYDNGCPSKFVNENVYIKVKPFIPTEKITGPNTACQNQQNVKYSILNLDTGHRYAWSVSGGLIVGGNTGNSIAVNWGNGSQGIVKLSVTSRWGCLSTPIQYLVGLTLAPMKPKITGPDTVCFEGVSTYEIVGNTTDRYTWKVFGGISNGVIPGSLEKLKVYWTTSTKGYVSVYGSNAAGCNSPVDTMRIVNAPSNKVKLDGPISVCPNNKNILYTISNLGWKATYSWKIFGGTNIRAKNDSQALADWGGLGSGGVLVNSIDRFGCPDTTFLAVRKTHNLVGQQPIGDSIVCELDNNIQFRIKQVSGEKYQWSIFGGNITTSDTIIKILTNWGTSGMGWVGVQSKAYDSISKLPCLSSIHKINVSKNPIPSLKLFTMPLQPDICQNTQWVDVFNWTIDVDDSIELQFTGLNYKIKNTINGSQLTKVFSININTIGTFAFKARQISKWGCVGPWYNTSVTINPKPIFKPLIGDSVVCFPHMNGYVYQISGNATSKYSWQLIGGKYSTNPGNSGTAVIDWDSMALLKKVIVVEISDKGCLGDSISTVVFYDNPKITSKWVTVSPPPLKDGQNLVQYVLWNAPRNKDSLVVQRRQFGMPQFWDIDQTSATDTLYNDIQVAPDNFAYDYRVVAINQCGDSIYSNINTSVLLTGKKIGALSMSFTFSPYLGWNNGVDRYELYRQLEDKSGYVLYKSYTVPSKDSFENGMDNFGQRYRIKAYELSGDRVSWSNDIILYYEPIIFIPNAFTPNGNGRNEEFRAECSGGKDFSMKIFSRWGEKLFETNDPKKGWNGTYNGKEVPIGVFVYYIQLKDYKDKIYDFNGTIQLLR